MPTITHRRKGGIWLTNGQKRQWVSSQFAATAFIMLALSKGQSWWDEREPSPVRKLLNQLLATPVLRVPPDTRWRCHLCKCHLIIGDPYREASFDRAHEYCIQACDREIKR